MPMGFDIECIIDIHNYPGEYFCPVCRTLVYPNEAVQSQCTHLYCKPCLSHVANGTKACPYDGYLVTESDSKPLVESDKTLVENIGKVKVYCLFFRSGCTWEGTLSECNSHCSACSFGNSPVICNRCGVQIVHRQVHEHAQSCPGGYVAQQAASGVVGTTGSSTTTATTSAYITPTVTQAAAPLPQAQNTQTVPLATPMPGQNNQPPLLVSGAVPTPEQQCYQQQYQQYYQQYAGYQLYQQPPQQHNPLQQQAYQQYQQHPVPVQAQNQSNVHPQAAPQPQLQNLTHLVPQPQQQTQLQPQQQAQLQPQQQAQLQPQPQAQVPPSVPNYQVNHQPPYPPIQGQAPIPPQTVPSSSAGHQIAPYPLAMGMRPAAQHAQVPQYQQPHASQAYIQPKMHLQPLSQHPPLPLSSNQSHVQIQQAQSYHIQSQTYPPPPQLSQANGPAPLPQGPHPPVPPASGHHSFPQPQPTTQQMQAGFPQQHPGHPHASSGFLNPLQAPHQPLMMHPPPSLGSLPQQQSSTMMPLQSQVPGISLPLAQQPPRSFQHRPVTQPSQQTVPQQYAQQQSFHAPFHGQSHQHGHFMQQSVQPPRAYGHLHSQQHQNYMGRPMEPNLGMHPQTIPQSSGDTNPVQLSSKQTSVNQNNVESTMLEQNTMEQAPRSPSNRPVETGFEQDSSKKEATVGQNGTVQSGGNAANGLSSIKQEVGLDSSLEQTSDGKFSEAGMQDDRKSREDNNVLKNSDSMKQEDRENRDMVSQVVVGGMSSTNSDKQSHMAVSGSTYEGNRVPSKSHSSFQQKPQSQFPAYSPPSIPGPKGPGWREPGYFGPPPNNFVSQSSNQRPPMNTSVDPHGFIGRAPRPHFEGQFGPQHPARPSGNAMFRDQRSVDGGPVAQILNNEPSFIRVNGGTAPESSMFDLRDEKEKTFAREHFDPFSVESTQPLNQSLGYTGNASRGQNYDAASKLDAAALGPHSTFPSSHHPSVGHRRMANFGASPEFGQHHMKHFDPRSHERVFRGFGGSIFPRGKSFADINGRKSHGFGEGSISFNPSTEFGNPFHDGRFPPSSGLLQRGNIDGPGNLRIGDHIARPLNNHVMRDEVFGPDGPGHLMRKDFRGPGYFSGQFNTAETAGPGAFPGRTPMTKYGTGSGMRNSYSGQGLPNAATFEGGPNPGWCRICKVDCETVEGLDMHSQTREHQKMAMDMVKTIKQQNKKKQRTSGVHISHDGRARKVGPEYHGNKR